MMAELSLKEHLEANEALFEKTGHQFGYEKLARKESDPGTYEAVWHILSNICNAAWSVGCMASTSPVAADRSAARQASTAADDSCGVIMSGCRPSCTQVAK